jgi:SAM-dependent methyltransferase
MITQMGGYAFDTSSAEERDRLALLEECYDPATIALLEGLGVATGWHCLQVGAGSGSIAFWLRDRVGRTGRVVAIDLDTRFVENEPGIEPRRADVLMGDLGSDEFDLVHCRALLHHLPGRQVEAVSRMAGRMRCGGTLVADEPYFGPMFASATAGWVSTWRAYCAAMSSTDYEWAVGLAAALQEAALVEIKTAGRAELLQGGTPGAELLRLSLEAVRERLPSGHDIEGAIRRLRDPAAFEPGMVWYAAWGRRAP